MTTTLTTLASRIGGGDGSATASFTVILNDKVMTQNGKEIIFHEVSPNLGDRLIRLTLETCDLTKWDASLFAVAMKSQTCVLQEINVVSCGLSDEQACHIVNALPGSTVTSVSFSNNDALTDKTLNALADALAKEDCKLTALDVSECRMSLTRSRKFLHPDACGKLESLNLSNLPDLCWNLAELLTALSKTKKIRHLSACKLEWSTDCTLALQKMMENTNIISLRLDDALSVLPNEWCVLANALRSSKTIQMLSLRRAIGVTMNVLEAFKRASNWHPSIRVIRVHDDRLNALYHIRFNYDVSNNIRRTDTICALLLATHPRLGRKSPAKGLSRDMFRLIANTLFKRE